MLPPDAEPQGLAFVSSFGGAAAQLLESISDAGAAHGNHKTAVQGTVYYVCGKMCVPQWFFI